MNYNEAYSIVIEHLISESKTKVFIDKLNIILKGVKGKKHVEEQFHPRFQSLILFGQNIFPFSDKEYLQIAELLKG